MKWTLRYAVLLAALVLALGSVGFMRPDAAMANDDVVLIGPTTDRGEPDTGGGTFAQLFGWQLSIGPSRGLFRFRRVSIVRSVSTTSARSASLTRRQGTARR